ncbi:MAG: aminotransferase class III-fold pyridoxal phosphate-dependent enzyme [Thermoflexales bacterium]|nr:aminotransferase class III-fold pyridoxal phosphate-dependent enzyme [Thermoflexales bacterium]
MPTIHYPRPAFTLADAARIAREYYALEGAVTELPGERDLNFRIQTAAGAFTLKIANAEEDRGDLEMQHAALAHLAARAPTLGLQRVIAARDGRSVLDVAAADGRHHLVRVLSFIPGRLWAHVHPHGMDLLASLGAALGALDRGLADFDAPQARRSLKWDLRQAGWIRAFINHIPEGPRRALVTRCLDDFEARVLPALEALPHGVIYNDANDYNIIVSGDGARVAGLIDFGDMCHTARIAEPAIAAAYAAMGLRDPVAGIARLIGGYHAACPVSEAELDVLHALILLRLCVSVTNSAYQKTVEPDNAYLTISEAPAWALLEQLAAVQPNFARYAYRAACGYPAHPLEGRLTAWLRAHQAEHGRVIEPDLRSAPLIYTDWSVGSPELGTPEDMADAEGFTERIWKRMKAAGAVAAIGGYDHARPVYGSEAFRHRGNDRHEWRTVHIGLDVFMDAGTPVYAPFDGVVHSFANNPDVFDYGPCIVLEHHVRDEAGPFTFFTLYGHLSMPSLDGLYDGRPFRKGDQIATLGNFPINGNWPPHLHFQIILDMLGKRGDYFGSCLPSQRAIWLSVCPNPNLVAQVPEALFPAPPPTAEALRAERRARLGGNLSLSYRTPLYITRGWKQWLYDVDGQRFLDAYNNVPHVGHSHPHVIAAAREQFALLNTNTRYLHDAILRYAERLAAKLPQPLGVCYFTASGSEANELAVRLARAATGRRDMLVMSGAYHGHTNTLIDLSPYKHDGPGGQGAPEWVHVSPTPDVYRGAFRAPMPDTGARYAGQVAALVDGLVARGRPPAAYLAETFPSVGGQIVPPQDFYPAVYAAVRAAGGICIADEVQTGFGRTGDTFWAFERYGVVPDIVVLGKPIANGYPMGAVITTPEIARAFDNGMEFFSTFGGSTAACVIANATLDVVEQEQLQANAARVGARLLDGLRALLARHPILGDVRGAGLFIGVEMTRDPATRAPATTQAAYVANRMRDFGVLLGTDGPDHNVLKIRPPLCFEPRNADFLLEMLDLALGEDAAR